MSPQRSRGCQSVLDPSCLGTEGRGQLWPTFFEESNTQRPQGTEEVGVGVNLPSQPGCSFSEARTRGHKRTSTESGQEAPPEKQRTAEVAEGGRSPAWTQSHDWPCPFTGQCLGPPPAPLLSIALGVPVMALVVALSVLQAWGGQKLWTTPEGTLPAVTILP